mmetsp:Transcript_26689/g.47418  ORF Transcript_26689/g.47418 Transcript_26689/m.47418 type:complete len:205 (-) Transcript_26689:200-814(-)
MEKARPVGCSLLMDNGIFREPRPTAGSARAMSDWKELSMTEGPRRKPTWVPSRSISSRAKPRASAFSTWTCRTARKRGCSGRPLFTPKEYMRSMSTTSLQLPLSCSRSCLSSATGLLAAQPPASCTRLASTCVDTMLSSGSLPTSLSTSSRPSAQITSRSSTGSSKRPSEERRSTRGFAKPRVSTHQACWRPRCSVTPAKIISK